MIVLASLLTERGRFRAQLPAGQAAKRRSDVNLSLRVRIFRYALRRREQLVRASRDDYIAGAQIRAADRSHLPDVLLDVDRNGVIAIALLTKDLRRSGRWIRDDRR